MVVAPPRNPGNRRKPPRGGDGCVLAHDVLAVHVHGEHDDDNGPHDVPHLLVVDAPHGEVPGNDSHHRPRQEPHEVLPGAVASPEDHRERISGDEQREQGTGGKARGKHLGEQGRQQDSKRGDPRL